MQVHLLGSTLAVRCAVHSTRIHQDAEVSVATQITRFVYENADKQRLTLQVRKPVNAGHETSFRYAVEDGVGVYYWIDENCTYALSGNLDRAQLLTIGRVVYGQLAALDVSAPK